MKSRIIWQSSLIVASLAVLLHAVVPSKLSFFEGSKGNRRPPLSVDRVVDAVSDYLWNKHPEFSKHKPTSFVIKGSYAASVWGYEHLNGVSLPYNDIDVYVETPVPNKRCPTKSNFLKSTYLRSMVPRSNVIMQLSIVCSADIKKLVYEDSDINAVNVGFKVVPNVGPDGETTPKIDNWTWSPNFEKFWETEKLELVDRVVSKRPNPQSSVVRLLRKAKQLNVDYQLPDDESLTKMLHGYAVSDREKQILDGLGTAYKNDIYGTFDLVQIPNEDSWYMFVRKGMPTPDPPRRLQTCPGGYYYDGYYCINPAEGNSGSSHFSKQTVSAIACAVGVFLVALI